MGISFFHAFAAGLNVKQHFQIFGSVFFYEKEHVIHRTASGLIVYNIGNLTKI